MNFTRLFDEILKVDTLIHTVKLSRAVCSVCQGMSGSWLKQILRYLPLEEPKSNKLFDTSSKQVSTCNLSYVTCLVIFGLWKITAWLVYVSCCWAIRQYFSGCGVFNFWIYDQTDVFLTVSLSRRFICCWGVCSTLLLFWSFCSIKNTRISNVFKSISH